jgi:hypothetical protein
LNIWFQYIGIGSETYWMNKKCGKKACSVGYSSVESG